MDHWRDPLFGFVLAQTYRKYTFDAEGRAVSRRLLVRKRIIVGLGKEANRIEDARVLGLQAVRGRAKRYVDPDLYAGSATEVAKRLGVSRRTVFNRREYARRRRLCTWPEETGR